MTRFFYAVFFSFLMLGIVCIVAAFFVTAVPDPFTVISEKPLNIQTAEVKEVPLERKIEKAANNPIRVVRVCQGEVENQLPVAELKFSDSEETPHELQKESQTHPSPIKRTYIFLSAEEGVPEIITAKVVRGEHETPDVSTVSITDANQQTIQEHGIRAEHGTFSQLSELDSARQLSRTQDLWADAAKLCFVEGQFNDRERDDEIDKLKLQATAYLQLDLELDPATSKIQIFYQVNGFIHQQEAFLSDRPI